MTLFEQPLDGFNLSGYRALCAASNVEIGIDESLRSTADLIEYVRADAIHVAVAKVQRNSGLYRSRQLCETAQAAGLGLSLSGLTETDLGLAAVLDALGHCLQSRDHVSFFERRLAFHRSAGTHESGRIERA